MRKLSHTTLRILPLYRLNYPPMRQPKQKIKHIKLLIKLNCAEIIQQTEYYNNELTVKVRHFQYLFLGFSFELEMNILMILLHPDISNSIDDELTMEREDIATRG